MLDGADGTADAPGRHRRPRPAPRRRGCGARGRRARRGCSAASEPAAVARRRSATRDRRAGARPVQTPPPTTRATATRPRPTAVAGSPGAARRPRRATRGRHPEAAAVDGGLVGCGREHHRRARTRSGPRSSTSRRIFVMPDWGGLIGLLPVLILLGVVGPFLTFLALGTMIYLIRKPRTKVDLRGRPAGRRDRRRRRADLPGRPAPLPARRARLPVGHGPLRALPATQLAVICPMCGLGRHGDRRHLHELRPRPEGQAAGGRVRTTSGPSPGGAAAA